MPLCPAEGRARPLVWPAVAEAPEGCSSLPLRPLHPTTETPTPGQGASGHRAPCPRLHHRPRKAPGAAAPPLMPPEAAVALPLSSVTWMMGRTLASPSSGEGAPSTDAHVTPMRFCSARAGRHGGDTEDGGGGWRQRLQCHRWGGPRDLREARAEGLLSRQALQPERRCHGRPPREPRGQGHTGAQEGHPPRWAFPGSGWLLSTQSSTWGEGGGVAPLPRRHHGNWRGELSQGPLCLSRRPVAQRNRIL